MALSTAAASPAKESFASLLEETLGATDSFEGTVVKGRIIAVENDMALIDVGLKSEGRVALKEFSAPGQTIELKPGDVVEVYIERGARRASYPVGGVEAAEGDAGLGERRRGKGGERDVGLPLQAAAGLGAQR